MSGGMTVKKTQLIIMAAGLGSRFGGLKQMAPVDQDGLFIIDYSIFDAVRAGFDEIIIIVKPENEQLFRDTIASRIGDRARIIFVHQKPDILPEGFSIPQGRVKPWGTAHAVLCARDVVDAPFCVINADDFYGAGAFRQMHDFLVENNDDSVLSMVGYLIRNTLTDNGSVSRGVCETSEDGQYMTAITERTTIIKQDNGAAFTEDGGKTYTFLPGDTAVSMNCWGFPACIMQEFVKRFPAFLEKNLPVNPLKCEYFLPLIPDQMIKEGSAKVRLLKTEDKWYGITYSEDLPDVQQAIDEMKKAGGYPQHLWK